MHIDCWKAYTLLEEQSCTHVMVNNLEDFDDPESGVCTQSIDATQLEFEEVIAKIETGKMLN